MSFCLIYRSKLTVFVITDATSFPCSARTTEVTGGRTGIQALSELLWKDHQISSGRAKTRSRRSQTSMKYRGNIICFKRNRH